MKPKRSTGLIVGKNRALTAERGDRTINLGSGKKM